MGPSEACIIKTILMSLLVVVVETTRQHSCRKIRNTIEDFHDSTQMTTDLSHIFNQQNTRNHCFKSNKRFIKSSYDIHYLGEKICNDINTTMVSKLNHERAICPWYYDISYDLDRKPSIMLNVKCRCPNKSHFNGTCFCEQMKMAIPVLRRLNRNSKWEATLETIGVSCICMLPISS